MSRILAVDFGDRRLGLAISDELGLTAQPLPTLHVQSIGEAVREVTRIAHDREVVTIVVGLPLLLSGEKGPRAVRTERFASELAAATGLPVRFQDERLTSAEAARYLDPGSARGDARAHDMRRRARGETDRVAAALILSSWLDRHRHETGA